MFPYSNDEAAAVFKSAKNLNSAVKNVLKNEVQKGDGVERFVKRFKNVAVSRREGAIEEFLERSLEQHERELLVVARYAHGASLEQITESIIDKYAEDFNASYESGASGVTVQDRDKFEGIANEVLRGLGAQLQECDLPDNGFMKNVLVHFIFEPEVVTELVPLIAKLGDN